MSLMLTAQHVQSEYDKAIEFHYNFFKRTYRVFLFIAFIAGQICRKILQMSIMFCSMKYPLVFFVFFGGGGVG